MIGHLFVAFLRESESGMACRAEPKDSIGNNLGCLNCPPRAATGESGLGLSKHGHPLKGEGGIAAPLRESDQIFDGRTNLVLEGLGLLQVRTNLLRHTFPLLAPQHHGSAQGEDDVGEGFGILLAGHLVADGTHRLMHFHDGIGQHRVAVDHLAVAFDEQLVGVEEAVGHSHDSVGNGVRVRVLHGQSFLASVIPESTFDSMWGV